MAKQLRRYNPEKGLKSIAVAEAGEKHFARAKDASKLFDAIAEKLTLQMEYVVWRDRQPKNKGGRGHKTDFRTEIGLPAADPGDLVIHRWRKKLCKPGEGGSVLDSDKYENVLADVYRRAVRICEQEKDGTIRGTEGTGEFERYTPAEYIEAARKALGEIDLDPATSKLAQETVRAVEYFTADDDGLKRDWYGRVWLNPPYHRDLAPKFIDKLVAEVFSGRVTAAIALTNNCTDTEWFSTAMKVCQAICFTRGRIKFTVPNSGEVLPTQGQAFFYFGNDTAAFEIAFSHIGFGVKGIWP
jgi:phage N-6-adenine-methyltransferase